MNIEDRLYVDTCSGIYYFKNLLNGKYYIGQAINIRKRLIHHLGNLSHNRYDAPLYKALQKYGIENFEFGILQRIEEEELFLKDILDFWEKYYITLYNSYGSTGYNQTKGGDAGVLGLKMTESQRQHISLNSKKQANDGRNKIFCYDTEKKITIQCPSLVTLSTYLNIPLNTSSIRNLLVAKRYILARTISTLQDKIAKYNSSELKVFNRKISEEAIQDIIKGMSQKEWVQKYNMCKASYSQYKRELVNEGKMTFKRVYTSKILKEEFIEYIKDHTVKEASIYFNVSHRLIYKYKEKYLNR